MSVCIALRDDYDSNQLRRLAKRCRDPRQVRLLLALAAAYDGMGRVEVAKVGGMDRQTLRDWAHRFNEEGPEGLKHRAGAGRPRLLSDEQMGELSVIVETGPDPMELLERCRTGDQRNPGEMTSRPHRWPVWQQDGASWIPP